MKTNSCSAEGTRNRHGQNDRGLLRRYILMSLLPNIRRPSLGWFLILAMPVLAWGQAAYVTNLAEYSISGALPGDQVRPQAAVNAQGGFLVWDDNAMDGHGQGIGALALDSNFKAVGAPFRVNQIVSKDQTRPQIALLANGGTVIVWQGGAAGREHIYARFLSASNTWLSGDILVNTPKGEFHKYPAVAALSNGNAVVVWGSYNQQTTSSMQDIYGQVLSPTGQKVGSEFLVNQFTLYNQRNPGVAALSSGGFIVVWVSEQQRSPADLSASNMVTQVSGPSCDVYGRVYGANGSLSGLNTNEFRVNAGGNPCTAPVLATAADGRVLVAWAEKDMQVHTNGWDIFARPIASNGLMGLAQRVNTYLVGDQFAPRIAANGGTAFLVWDSMGQDGSWEGVYGRFLQFDGTMLGGEVRLNTTTVGRQIHPAVVADGSARFLGLWACYANAQSAVDLFAQQYAAPGYVPVPATASVFAAPANDPLPEILPNGEITSVKIVAGTTDLGTSDVLALAPPVGMAPTNAAPALASVAGTYNGLVWDTNQVAANTAGFVTLTTASQPTSKGDLAYSGKLNLAGKSYSFSGKFYAGTGIATNFTLTSPSSFLQLQLQASLYGGDQIQGSLVSLAANGKTNWVSSVVADRAAAGVGAGKSFTMVVPPVTNAPVGFGYATVKIDTAGNLQWSGVLADGTPVSQTTAISKQGLWPLYASLYGGGGLAVSWMQFTTNGNTLGGQFIWIKNGGLGAPYTNQYAAGITNAGAVEGALYTPPTGKALMLNPTNLVTFSGGGLTNKTHSFNNWFSLNSRNQVSSTNKQFQISFSTASGLFSGNALNPQTGKPMSFAGVIYQGTNGAGLFPGTKENGQVFIAPAK